MVFSGSDHTQTEFDGYSVWNRNAHQLVECTRIRSLGADQFQETLVNSHLPVIPSFATFAVGCLAAWDDQASCGQRDGSAKFDTGLIANATNVCTNFVDVYVVLTSQFDGGNRWH